MSERPVWPQRHYAHAFWFEKAVGAVLLIGGTVMAYFTEPWLQYFFMVLAGFGLNATLPSSRPLFSNIVDRLPFLESKQEKEK